MKEGNHVPGRKEIPNFGGYSGSHVAHEKFVIRIPEKADKAKIAPVLCAGITMYEPLVYHGAKTEKNMKIGIVGLGGLGTMGIKLAKALGQTVYAISSNVNKESLAKEKGADFFICS